MGPSVNELIQRFDDLTLGVAAPGRFERVFADAAAKFNFIGTPVLHAIMTADKDVMSNVEAEVLEAFSEIEAASPADNKAVLLAPLKDRALQRYDEAAAAALRVRTSAADRILNSIQAEGMERFGANREEIRRQLVAKIDGVLGRADAGSERDRRVQHRALRTSLLVSGCGVLLSALITLTVQLHKERTDLISRNDDRRYQARQDGRGQVIPVLDSMMVGLLGLQESAAHPREFRLALQVLREANHGLIAPGRVDSSQMAITFNDSIAGVFSRLMTETFWVQETADSLYNRPNRSSKELSEPLVDSPQWQAFADSAKKARDLALVLRDELISFDRLR